MDSRLEVNLCKIHLFPLDGSRERKTENGCSLSRQVNRERLSWTSKPFVRTNYSIDTITWRSILNDAKVAFHLSHWAIDQRRGGWMKWWSNNGPVMCLAIALFRTRCAFEMEITLRLISYPEYRRLFWWNICWRSWKRWKAYLESKEAKNNVTSECTFCCTRFEQPVGSKSSGLW